MHPPLFAEMCIKSDMLGTDEWFPAQMPAEVDRIRPNTLWESEQQGLGRPARPINRGWSMIAGVTLPANSLGGGGPEVVLQLLLPRASAWSSCPGSGGSHDGRKHARCNHGQSWRLAVRGPMGPLGPGVVGRPRVRHCVRCVSPRSCSQRCARGIRLCFLSHPCPTPRPLRRTRPLTATPPLIAPSSSRLTAWEAALSRMVALIRGLSQSGSLRRLLTNCPSVDLLTTQSVGEISTIKGLTPWRAAQLRRSPRCPSSPQYLPSSTGWPHTTPRLHTPKVPRARAIPPHVATNRVIRATRPKTRIPMRRLRTPG